MDINSKSFSFTGCRECLAIKVHLPYIHHEASLASNPPAQIGAADEVHASLTPTLTHP